MIENKGIGVGLSRWHLHLDVVRELVCSMAPVHTWFGLVCFLMESVLKVLNIEAFYHGFHLNSCQRSLLFVFYCRSEHARIRRGLVALMARYSERYNYRNCATVAMLLESAICCIFFQLLYCNSYVSDDYLAPGRHQCPID